jgi:hypothetical protein
MTFKLLQASEAELISGGHRRPVRLNTDYVDIDATYVRTSGNFVANRDNSFREATIVIGDVF